MNKVKFNEIQIGRKFKVSSGITYQKMTNEQAKPIKKADGSTIQNGKVTTTFYNSNILLTPVV